MFNNVFRKSCHLCNNIEKVVEPKGPQMAIWRRVACWISKATRAQAYTSDHAPTHTHMHRSTNAQARTLTNPEICETLLFQGNNGFVNAPKRYVTRTLAVLL
jgi:hypothetical protein